MSRKIIMQAIRDRLAHNNSPLPREHLEEIKQLLSLRTPPEAHPLQAAVPLILARGKALIKADDWKQSIATRNEQELTRTKEHLDDFARGLARAAAKQNPHPISQEDADQMLADALADKAEGVDRLLEIDLNPNQAAALLSFAYNVGLGNLKSSTLLRLVNAGSFGDVPKQFLRWANVNGQMVRGLLRRRQAEADLWSADA